MLDAPRHCVLYVRKSTDREDKQILSIPAQLKELREFALRANLVIDAEIEEAYSAREPGRPLFSRLLGDIAAGRVERILSWKLDRLARNPIDGGALIHFLGKGNLKEIVTLEGSYTGSSDSKFMLSVLFGAATKMTDDLVMGVRRGNKAVHEKGRITGSPPTGYIKIRDRHGYRGAGMVVPDPERFPILKRAFQDILTGTYTMAEAWRRATASGLTRRETPNRASAPIGINHFFKLLTNPFYCGRIVRCGEVFAGEHEPMITHAEYEKIQTIIHRGDALRPKNPENRFLYRGLLRCGHCDRGLTGERIKGRFVYYRCSRKRQDRERCLAPAPNEGQVTAAIEETLRRAALPGPVIDWTLRAVDIHIEQQRALHGRAKRQRESELAVAEHALNDLTDLRLAGDLTDAEYRTRRPALLERIEDLRRDLADPTVRLEEWRTFIANTLRWGKTALAGFQNGSDDEKRQLVVEGCVNLPVTDRILKPALRFPYCVLPEAPKIGGGRKSGGVNRLPAPATVVNLRKNARPRDARLRAFSQWWTRVRDVGTTATTGS